MADAPGTGRNITNGPPSGARTVQEIGSLAPKAAPTLYNQTNVTVGAGATIAYGINWGTANATAGWSGDTFSAVAFMATSGASWSGYVAITETDAVGNSWWNTQHKTTVTTQAFGEVGGQLGTTIGNDLFVVSVNNSGASSATVSLRLILWP